MIPRLHPISRECRKLDPSAWADPTDDPVPPVGAVIAVETRRAWEREMRDLRARADRIEMILNGQPS